MLLREIEDAGLCRTVMRAFPTAVRQGVRFLIYLGLVTRADPDEFEAAADRVSVFEVTPDLRT